MIEFYKILVTIAVALISVTMTIYAIAISVLGSEKARLQAQIDDINRRSDERFARGEIKDRMAAEQEIQRVTEESGKITSLLSSLSVGNVVFLPNSCFVISLASAIGGLLGYRGEVIWQGSLFFLILGGVLLANALRSIEKAASQPRPTATSEQVPHIPRFVPTDKSVPETGVVAYRFPDAGLILVNWSAKAAYTLWDGRTYDAIETGKIKLVMMGNMKLGDFLKEKGLSTFIRTPTEQELPL